MKAPRGDIQNFTKIDVVAIVTVNELNYWIIKLSQLGLGFITKSLLFIAINQ